MRSNNNQTAPPFITFLNPSISFIQMSIAARVKMRQGYKQKVHKNYKFSYLWIKYVYKSKCCKSKLSNYLYEVKCQNMFLLFHFYLFVEPTKKKKNIQQFNDVWCLWGQYMRVNIMAIIPFLVNAQFEY